jgi:hypothetical protein
MTYFDQFFEIATADKARELKPFWAVADKDEDELKKWLNETLDILKQVSRNRIYTMRRNLAAYRGVQFKSQSTKNNLDTESREDNKRSKNPRIVINHLLDTIEQHVSKTTKYRPATTTIPGSEDIDDKNVASIADELLENFFVKQEIDTVMQKHTRIKRVCGESYVSITWDKNLGPYHPDWVQEVLDKAGIKGDARKLSKGQINRLLRKVTDWPKIQLLDENGEQVRDSKGEPIYIDKPVRIGDIKIKLLMPWKVFLQRRDDEQECEFVFVLELDHVDNIRADYPDKARHFDSIKGVDDFDAASLNMERYHNEVEKVHFWHKTTNKLDRGKYICFTKECILVNIDNPYEGPYGRILPIDRLTDLNPPGTIDGDALTTHGIPAQHLYNIGVSTQARNQFLFSHPKWFVPQGSTKTESLANQTSIVQYKGAQPPILSQPSNTASDTYRYQDNAKQDLQQLMGAYGVSRGDPPPGIKSGVALQFLDEQENERENLAIAKHNASIRNIAKQVLSIMGFRYNDDEQRLSDILGKSKASDIESFQFSNLCSIEDVITQTSSALPNQKSARMQTLLDLNERFPADVDGRHVLDMIGLGQSDKYVSIATTAVRSAELENDKIIRTGNAGDAEYWEDHLQHYYIHLYMLNEPSYKKILDKKRRQELEIHMRTHEMFMQEIMAKNPMYAQLVMQKFPMFPIFLKKEEILPVALPTADQGLIAQGQNASIQEMPMSLPPGMETQAPVATEPVAAGNAVPQQVL